MFQTGFITVKVNMGTDCDGTSLAAFRKQVSRHQESRVSPCYLLASSWDQLQ